MRNVHRHVRRQAFRRPSGCGRSHFSSGDGLRSCRIRGTWAQRARTPLLILSLGSCVVGVAALTDGQAATAASPSAQRGGAPHTLGPNAVPAVRQPLTTNADSAVTHDTETVALVSHAGRLFAATDQWEYQGPSAFGQVLVKKSKTSAWTVFEQTRSLRVQALDSFPIPADQGLGRGHSLLVTQAIVAGHPRIQWLVDGANSFSLRIPTSFPRAPTSERSGRTNPEGSGRSMPASAQPESSRASGRRVATRWCSIPSPSSPWPRRDLGAR